MALEDVGNYTHITTSTTTNVLPGGPLPGTPGFLGILLGLEVNTGAAGWSLTVYDGYNGSGPVVAVIAATAVTSVFQGRVRLKNGLSIVSAGGSAGDATVIWL